jgi:hypothetical protein
MKNTYKVILGLFVIVAVFCGGCSKFLDKQPAGVESSTSFFQTADQANRALIAAYGAIAAQYSTDAANWFNQWMIGDIVSDDATKGGEGPADIADLQHLRDFQANAQNTIITPQYQIPYIGIYRANLVIDSVPKIEMDTALRSRYVAEAKFLRAWSYFILVRTFGDVPLVLHRLDPSDYCMARTPKDQVWAQIDTDLTQAAAVLPQKSGYDGSDLGRATAGAAKALLVKAYIYQKNFTAAEPLAQDIIASGEYTLWANFANNFNSDGENGRESVFEIQYLIDPADSWNNTNQGQVVSVFQASRSDPYFPGWGFDVPTQNLINDFEPGDKRLHATIIFPGDTLYGGALVIGDTAPDIATALCPRKYLLEDQGADGVPDAANAPNNWRAIRFSEVLLFHAEAANENGNAAGALVSLNRVRTRAGLTATPAGLSQDSLRKVIYHERRVELALEGHRFWDVVRQGRGAEVFGSSAANAPIKGFVPTVNEVFAIPQIEIDVCSKIIQNNGY